MRSREEIEEIVTELEVEQPGLYTPYVATHRARYVEAALFVQDLKPDRILELGASWPWFFTRLLTKLFPSAEIVLSENRYPLDFSVAGHPAERLRRVVSTDDVTGSREYRMRNFNVEAEEWPFGDETFDLIICMELLEHLLLNPHWVFRESHRLLREGGILMLTTPNVASVEGVQRMINGYAPYSYGVYSPHGPYGRHNREFGPLEVDKLGVSAGFMTDSLDTRDVYPRSFEAQNLREMIFRFGARPEFLNQAIFYRGVKSNGGICAGPPDFLYDWDPEEYVLQLSSDNVASQAKPSSDFRLKIHIRNCGKASLKPSEAWLRATWIRLEQWSRLTHTKHELTAEIPPAASGTVEVVMSSPPSPGIYQLFVDMEKPNRPIMANGAIPIHRPMRALVVVTEPFNLKRWGVRLLHRLPSIMKRA